MDDNGDSGWIKGLPAGWIDGFICARRLFAHFRTEYADADPAPWHDVVNAEYWGPHLGNSPEEYTLNEKLSERLVAVIQKAVYSGQLRPSWFDGSVFKTIPAHAFSNRRVVHNALLNGGFEVDPLWPDDWQHWSNHGWAIPKEQFETWLQTDHPLSMSGLPVSDDEMPPCDVLAVTSRMPSDASRVPLSEAITWIAFGVALDAERLERAIRWERLADGDLQAAQRQMEAATASLLKAGSDGSVPLFGRHIEAHGEKGKRTERIDPLVLEDYRRALIVSHDNLYYGEGLSIWFDAPNRASRASGGERSDYFAKVTVDRAELLTRFPLQASHVAANTPRDDGPIVWDDFGSECLPELQRLSKLAARDEWWTWPEAITWIGSRDAKNIATLRYWGQELFGRAGGDRDPTLILGGQALMAEQYCKSGSDIQAELLNAILSGEVGTSGRLSKGAVATDLQPSIWRGGTIVWHDGEAVLVDAKQRLTAWAFDVAIRREDLERAFPSPPLHDGSNDLDLSYYVGGITYVFDDNSSASTQKNKGGRPREFDREKLRARALELKRNDPSITIGSAAASLAWEFAPKTGKKKGKPLDSRGVEKLIADLM